MLLKIEEMIDKGVELAGLENVTIFGMMAVMLVVSWVVIIVLWKKIGKMDEFKRNLLQKYWELSGELKNILKR